MYFKRLTDLRNDKDMTQKQIASKLHCHRVVYQRYETGIRTIPIDMLMTLSDIYGTSIDYLVELTDVKVPYERKNPDSL